MSKMRLFVAVLLLAFVLNVTVPFFATYTATQTVNAEKTLSVFGDKILICTVDGFRWIDLADLKLGKVPQKNHEVKCPICYVSAHVGKSLQPHIEIVEYYAPHNLSLVEYQSELRNFDRFAYYQPNLGRAPPYSFGV